MLQTLSPLPPPPPIFLVVMVVGVIVVVVGCSHLHRHLYTVSLLLCLLADGWRQSPNVRVSFAHDIFLGRIVLIVFSIATMSIYTTYVYLPPWIDHVLELARHLS